MLVVGKEMHRFLRTLILSLCLITRSWVDVRADSFVSLIDNNSNGWLRLTEHRIVVPELLNIMKRRIEKHSSRSYNEEKGLEIRKDIA